MEMERLYPGLAILPIVRADRKTLDFKQLLGTGFFYGDGKRILSVAHVLKVQPDQDEILAVHLAPPGGGYARTLPIKNVRASRNYDLAVAEVPQATGFQTLNIAAQDPDGMPTLLTYDYSSGLRGGWRPDGTQGRRFIPYVWRGTWLATYIAHEPGMPRPAKIIDVPFPVMQGASGARLVKQGSRDVVGVLFGNVARQLVPPPQLAEIGQPWYLPVGQALHCSHVREFLREL